MDFPRITLCEDSSSKYSACVTIEDPGTGPTSSVLFGYFVEMAKNPDLLSIFANKSFSISTSSRIGNKKFDALKGMPTQDRLILLELLKPLSEHLGDAVNYLVSHPDIIWVCSKYLAMVTITQRFQTLSLLLNVPIYDVLNKGAYQPKEPFVEEPLHVSFDGACGRYYVLRPPKVKAKVVDWKYNAQISVRDMVKLFVSMPFKDPPIFKKMVEGKEIQRGDIEIYKFVKVDLDSVFKNSFENCTSKLQKAYDTFASLVEEIADLSVPQLKKKLSLKNDSDSIILECGCKVWKKEVIEAAINISNKVRNVPWQVMCMWRKNCGHILTDQELIKAMGIELYHNCMVEYSSRKPIGLSNCVLCGTASRVIVLHLNHTICKTCKERYASTKQGPRIPCPVRACPCYFFAS